MGIRKSSTRSAADMTIQVVLLSITLIGMAVIAGWHLNARPLVGVIPGAIPMQYNTALCLVVLGASGWTLLAWRGHRALPALGGAFVAAMGMMVIFEYATGISLRIDTLFFYPWDQTLSADPGRMALTTALSFTCAGSALTALAWRSDAVAVFVVAHTLPLSFSMTSVMGYLLGVTYVLPFHLGSQMAVHTASSIMIYSAAMMAYAWRRAPHSQEGLPAWSPALATVIVPVLFVAFSSVTQASSALMRVGQLFFALVGAALLGFAIHKLRHIRIVYKGLILVSIPLVFMLAFVLLVTAMNRSSKEQQAWSLHSKEVLAQAHELMRSLVDAETGVRGYVITDNPELAQPYFRATKEVPEMLYRLRLLVSDDPAQEARADRLGDEASERMEQLSRVEQLMRLGAKERAIELMKTGEGSNRMNDFRQHMNEFLQEAEQLDRMRREAVEASWQRLNWLLVAGTATDIMLAFIVALLFSQGISKRLLVLTRNARALAEGEKLSEPMTGSDEIAKLDEVFHDMTRALDARQSQLEAANKELEAFSYSISHDLRAPLRAIDGFSRILLEDYAERLDAEGLRVLDVIRNNAQSMGQLIDDLLAFSRLSRKQMETSSIDMRGLAQDVFGQLGTDADAGNAPRLKIEDLPPASGDRALMRQVFINLISNAIKYSKPKESRVIEVGGGRVNGENIYYVRDNGVGFDMQYVDKLFGVFQRLHSAGEFEGTGVGLAIVQRVVQRHGGRVWAEGEVSKGATFYFALPRNGESHNGQSTERE